MNPDCTLLRRSLVSSLEVLESRIAPAYGVAISVPPGEPAVTLDLAQDFYGPEVAHNAPVTYHFFVENDGGSTAPAVALHFLFPDNANTSGLDNPGWTPNEDGTYDYTVGDLAPGFSRNVDFSLRVGGFIGDTDLDALVFSASATYRGSAPSDPGLKDSIITPIYQGSYAVASGVAKPGHFATTEVRIFDVHTGEPAQLDWLDENGAFKAYPDVMIRGRAIPVRDSVRLTMGDFNGDGFDDIVTATAHGVGPVKIFDGITGEVIKSLEPFNGRKGLFVAAGDLNGDLAADLVLGSALGGGSVQAYDGKSFAPIGGTFTPFGKAFKGGVRVAVANLDFFSGEGFNGGEIIAAQGNFGNRVNVYNLHFNGDFPFGSTDATIHLRDTFTVGGAKYRGGLNVSAGDLDGDGRAEIVVGRNRLSSAIVDIFGLPNSEPTFKVTAQTNAPEGPHFVNLRHFTAFNASFQQGVRVAVVDVDGDGIQDIVAAAGYSGGGRVRVFTGQADFEDEFGSYNLDLHFKYDPSLAFKAFGGNQPAIWVAGTSPITFARRDVDYSERPE
jgi:hypothetical protein